MMSRSMGCWGVVALLALTACSKKSADESKPAPAAAPAAAATPGVIRGEIDVLPELKAKVTPSHAIFVSARPPTGGPPLAAKRLPMSTFPLAFELSAADAMIQGGPPFAGDVELTVRIDADGDVMSRAPGDLVWKSPAKVGDGAVKVMISEALP